MSLFVQLFDQQRVPIRPQGLTLTVDALSWAAQGGPKQASVSGVGDEVYLWQVIAWLGIEIIIVDENQTRRWWGEITRVTIAIGPYTFGLALDSMANRVAVAFEERIAGTEGTGERQTTLWTQDNASITRYGIIEALLTLSSATPEAALQYRDAALQRGRLPVPTIGIADQAQSSVTIECSGWWHRLKRRQVQITPFGSRIEAGGTPTQTPIPDVGGPVYGYMQRVIVPTTSITAAQFRLQQIGTPAPIVVSLFEDVGGRFGQQLAQTALTPGMASGTLNWTHIPFATPVTTTPNTAYWLAISTSNLTGLSASNTYRVQRALDQRGSELATIRYRNGAWAPVEGSLFYRLVAPGDQIVAELAASGDTQLDDVPAFPLPILGLAQRFIAIGAVPFRAESLALRLGRIGNPGQPLLVGLHHDAAGSIGALIDQVPVTLAAGDVAWQRVAFRAAAFLAPLSWYWIVISQPNTVGIDPNNTYLVEHANTDISVAGTFQRYQGNWQSVTGELYYSLGGIAQSTDLAVHLLQQYGVFSGSRAVASGVFTAGYEDGDSGAQTVIEELLSLGSTQATRLLATVDASRFVTIGHEPQPSAFRYLIDRDGTLRTRNGLALPPGEVPVGQWARLKDVLPGGLDALIADPTLIFIEEAEYQVARNRWIPTPRGQPTIWDLS